MSLFDTLQVVGGVERSLAKYGFTLNDCVQRRKTSAADTWTGTIPISSIAAAPIFPYGAQVILRTNRQSATGADNSFSGGVTKFQGYRVKNPMKARGNSQNVVFEFQGPWFALDITQYLQQYKGSAANYYPGEVVLNTASAPLISTAGLRFISMGDQIQAILQFVLDGYAAQGLPPPFQYVGRTLVGGAINLDAAGNAGAPNENTDISGNIYNQKLSVAAINGSPIAGATTTIDVSLYRNFLKSEIIRPMSAAQCLQKLLDSSPRTNIAFDYTTTPPMVYVWNIDNLPATALPLFDASTHTSLDIQRRDDLVPASVIIGYRITNSTNGQQQTDYAKDKWGPNGYNNAADPDIGPGVVTQTLDLQGFSQSITTAQLTTSPLAAIGGTQATKRAWWASKQGGDHPELEDSRVRFQDANGNATTIPDIKFYYVLNGVDSTGAPVVADQEFTAADYAFYGNRIVDGGHHGWMRINNNPNGVPVLAVKAKGKASMTYFEFDATGASETDQSGNKTKQYNNAEKHTVITLTNAPGGTYFTTGSFTPGEVFIQGNGGIAQYLFNMLSVLQYEGEYVKVEANFTNGVSLLNRANFTNGLAEWAAMNAQIQEIEENWGRKITRVRIGISKHLSAQQLSAFLNMWRTRRTWYNPQLKADNTIGTGGNVQMADANGNSNTMPGVDNVKQTAHYSYSVQPAANTPGVVKVAVINDPDEIATIYGL